VLQLLPARFYVVIVGIAIVCTSFLSACSRAPSSSFPPLQQPASTQQSASGRVVPKGAHLSPAAPNVPNIFAAANGLRLTNSQLDSYISSSVVGEDRSVALKIMTMMPPNQRGDFVYLESNGHLVTNNPPLLKQIAVTTTSAGSPSTPFAAKRPPGVQRGSTLSAPGGRPHIEADYEAPCTGNPPDPPSTPSGALRSRSL
jgi:hypothetical protein